MKNTDSAVLCVNSTVQATRDNFKDGKISPLHYWGYVPDPGDIVLGHRRNRWEIKLRSYCGGLDLPVFLRTFWHLLGGVRNLYLVSQPDLIQALPLLKFFFPRLKIVTWVWIPEEVRRWKKYLNHADHIFSLSDIGLEELRVQGLGSRASLGIWGSDPEFYRKQTGNQENIDILFLGIAARDVNMVLAMAEGGQYQVYTTQKITRLLRIPKSDDLHVVEAPETYAEMVQLIWRAKVCIIPLFATEVCPTGFTNLIEALLCGSAVVIVDSSTIPREVLALPGVYLYRTGNVDSCREQIGLALKDGQAEDFRERVREAASGLLNGRAIRETLKRVYAAG